MCGGDIHGKRKAESGMMLLQVKEHCRLMPAESRGGARVTSSPGLEKEQLCQQVGFRMSE